nr:hypothetical protein [Nitratireductor aestuarii]
MTTLDSSETDADVGGLAAVGGTTAMVNVEPSEKNTPADDAPHAIAAE